MEPTIISPQNPGQQSDNHIPEAPPTQPFLKDKQTTSPVVGDHTPRFRAGKFKQLSVLAAFVLLFGGTGSYFLFASHADVLSPNGRIFYSNGFSINLDGTGKSQNSSTAPLTNFDWSFSKQGNRIASVQPIQSSANLSQGSNIVVADADGGNQTTVLSNIPVFENSGKISWSPDGQWLAFGVGTSSEQFGASYPATIGLVHPDGSDYHQIPNITMDVYKAFGGVSWMPDSQQLVYTTNDGLCTTDLNGSANCIALNKPSNYFFTHPQVSPDGTKVLIENISSIYTDPQGAISQAYDLYEVNIDGSHLQNLTNVPQATSQNTIEANDGVWSPDGSLIAYGINGYNDATDGTNTKGLYVMSADGSNAHKIDTAQGYSIQWQHKQPTDLVASQYSNGNIFVNGNSVLTADGKSSGYTNFASAPYDGISWTGKQFSSLYFPMTGKPNTIYVSNFSDTNKSQPKAYPITGATYVRYTAWSRTPAADSSGQKIAFSDDGAIGVPVLNEKIGSVDLTTGAVTNYPITNNSTGTGFSNPKLYSDYAQIDGLDWSQNNSDIYYAMYDSATNQGNILTLCDYTISTQATVCDGDNQIKLGLTNNSTSSTDLTKVVWSSDDTRIAYAYKGGVYVANRDGSNPTQVATTDYNASNPTNTYLEWMPDGQSLVVSGTVNSKPVLYSVNIASKSKVTLNSDGPYTINGLGSLVIQPIPLQPADTTPPQVTNISVNNLGNGTGSHRDWLINFHASDNTGVAKVEVYANGTLVTSAAGSSTSQDFGSLVLPASKLGYGANMITVKAYDYAGNVTSANATSVVNRGYVYTGVTPSRIVDTRPNSGKLLAGKTLGAGKTLDVPVAGNGGVPQTGVSAVVLNITENGATANSYFQVYPTGKVRPTTSTLNFQKAVTVNNQTTATLGTNGQVTVFNSAGTSNLIVDVIGYYSSTGNTFTPVTPARLADTRTNSGQLNAGKTLAANSALTMQAAGVIGVPANASDVVVEITNVNSKANGYITAYAAGLARPGTSNLNYTTSSATRESTVHVGTAGAITIFSGSAATTDVLVDVVGYYAPDPAGLTFVPLTPQRLADTRNNSGQNYQGKHLIAGGTLGINISTNSTIPTTARSLVTNATITGATAQTAHVTYPHGIARPGVTTNFAQAGVNTSNEGTYSFGVSNQQFDTYNSAGTSDLIVDALGYYY